MRAFSRFSAGNFKIFLPRWVLMLVRREDMWPTWSPGCDFLRFLKSTEIIVWIISNWIMLQRSSERNHYNFFHVYNLSCFYMVYPLRHNDNCLRTANFGLCKDILCCYSFSLRALRTLAATASLAMFPKRWEFDFWTLTPKRKKRCTFEASYFHLRKNLSWRPRQNVIVLRTTHEHAQLMRLRL